MFHRALACLSVAAAALVPAAAEANFYWKAPDFSAAPVRGDEPGVSASPLPGATPAELQAAVLWNLRSALNVAALQCQFDPTLLTRPHYNHILEDHRAELGAAYQSIANYFKRTDRRKGQALLDTWGTRTYSSFSAVGLPQYNFCETAAKIAREALFTPRGQLHVLARNRIGEIRNSLTMRLAEQQFRYPPVQFTPRYVRLEEACWKKGVLRDNCRR